MNACACVADFAMMDFQTCKTVNSSQSFGHTTSARATHCTAVSQGERSRSAYCALRIIFVTPIAHEDVRWTKIPFGQHISARMHDTQNTNHKGGFVSRSIKSRKWRLLVLSRGAFAFQESHTVYHIHAIANACVSFEYFIRRIEVCSWQ
jgi:hypothetical protein